jgi:hypothetical protein
MDAIYIQGAVRERLLQQHPLKRLERNGLTFSPQRDFFTSPAAKIAQPKPLAILPKAASPRLPRRAELPPLEKLPPSKIETQELPRVVLETPRRLPTTASRSVNNIIGHDKIRAGELAPSITVGGNMTDFQAGLIIGIIESTLGFFWGVILLLIQYAIDEYRLEQERRRRQERRYRQAIKNLRTYLIAGILVSFVFPIIFIKFLEFVPDSTSKLILIGIGIGTTILSYIFASRAWRKKGPQEEPVNTQVIDQRDDQLPPDDQIKRMGSAK